MKFNLQTNIIIALVLGVLAGLYLHEFYPVFEFLGQSFITLLKYIVVPLVFASLTSGVISLGNLSALRNMGFKTLVYFIITTFISSTIGILLASFINPGKGFFIENTENAGVTEPLTFQQMFAQIIPSDFITFLSGGNMLFLILISLVLGIIVVSFGKNRSFPLDELFDGFNEFMMIITGWVIAISPIGIFGLIAQLVATTGIDSFVPLIKYMLVVVLGLLIHAFIIIPLFLRLFLRVSPISVAKDVFTSLTTGFTTAATA